MNVRYDKALEQGPCDTPGDLQVIRRPRCPGCKSVQIEVRSTRKQGDGTLLRYCRCRECGQTLKVVVE